jgi:aspartate aminotransferase
VKCGEEQRFKITPAQLEAAITDKTRLVVLNSPSNPTGMIYTKAELEALAEVLRRHPQVFVASDDMYEPIRWEDKFYNIATVAPDLYDRTIVLNGVSKAYAMTGWRIGFAAGPHDLISALSMLQSQSTSNACSIAQGAAAVAFTGPHNFLNEWRVCYTQRRDEVVQNIAAIHGLSCSVPPGAFYVYVNCSGVMGFLRPNGALIETDQDFCTYLLEEAKVAVVSGNAFGLSPYFRLSYATSIENLREALKRIKEAVERLRVQKSSF